MGGFCSKSSRGEVNAAGKRNIWGDTRRQVEDYKSRSSKRTSTDVAPLASAAMDMDTQQQQLQEPQVLERDGPALVYGAAGGGGDAADDFYDGIPRYKSSSFRSKAKVSFV